LHPAALANMLYLVTNYRNYTVAIRGDTGDRLRIEGTSRVFIPHKLYAARSKVPRETIWWHRCKKTLRQPGSALDPTGGAYSAPQTLWLVGGGWLPPPQ